MYCLFRHRQNWGHSIEGEFHLSLTYKLSGQLACHFNFIKIIMFTILYMMIIINPKMNMHFIVWSCRFPYFAWWLIVVFSGSYLRKHLNKFISPSFMPRKYLPPDRHFTKMSIIKKSSNKQYIPIKIC